MFSIEEYIIPPENVTGLGQSNKMVIKPSHDAKTFTIVSSEIDANHTIDTVLSRFLPHIQQRLHHKTGDKPKEQIGDKSGDKTCLCFTRFRHRYDGGGKYEHSIIIKDCPVCAGDCLVQWSDQDSKGPVGERLSTQVDQAPYVIKYMIESSNVRLAEAQKSIRQAQADLTKAREMIAAMLADT